MDYNSDIIHQSGAGSFLDIGANHGVYSIEAAPLKRIVYAFEPHPVNIEILTKATADLQNVIVVPLAASNKAGTVSLFECSNPGGHSISEAVGSTTNWGHDPHNKFNVECVTIDQFIENQQITDLVAVKIDVEGAEQLVLEGMIETLKRFNLLVALETHHTIDCAAIYNIIDQCGYEVISRMGVVTELIIDRQYLLRRKS